MPLRERRRRPAAHARHADRGNVPNRTARPSFASRPRRRCVRCASGCTPRRTSGMALMSPPACSRPDSSRRGPARPHASPRSRHAPTDRAPPRDSCAPADHRASLVEHHGTDRHVTLLPGAPPSAIASHIASSSSPMRPVYRNRALKTCRYKIRTAIFQYIDFCICEF